MEKTILQLEPLLHSQVVGPWSLNSYALVCPDTRASMLFDPGADPSTLMSMLSGSKPQAIVITHSHADHIGALQEMRSLLGVPVLAHPGTDPASSPVRADDWLSDGQKLTLGQYTILVQHSPGHTDDQVCFRILGDHRVLVGDTIFGGGPGKTWSPAAFKTTQMTLRTTVLSWPEHTVCYPGHGNHFRLCDLRADIERFVSRDYGTFYGDATWDMDG